MAFDGLSRVKWKQDKIEFSMYAFECGNAEVFAYACTYSKIQFQLSRLDINLEASLLSYW